MRQDRQTILNTSFSGVASIGQRRHDNTAVILNDHGLATSDLPSNRTDATGFIGIAQEITAAGEMVDVLVEGIGWVEAAGVVNIGDQLILAATAAKLRRSQSPAKKTRLSLARP